MTLRLLPPLIVVLIAFAANSVLNRMALAETATGPASFAALRLASGALVLGLLVAARAGTRPSRADLRGSIGPALALLTYMLFFSFAYLSLDAGIGALILFGGVQVTMFAGALLAGEAMPQRRWLGAGLAFGGLAYLLWPEGAHAPALLGSVMMLAAAAGWGIYSLQGRSRSDPLLSTALAFALALPASVLLWAVLRDGMDARGAVLAVLSGGVTSALGYALWYRLLPSMAASTAGVAQLTVPVIALMGGMLLLAEPVTLRFVIAAVLVLGGVGWALVPPRVPMR